MRCAIRRAWTVLALLLAAPAIGCGQAPGSTGPDSGALTLTITPVDTTVASLELASASVGVDNITVIGDVTPDGRSMVASATIDLLSAGSRFTFTTLPEGVYSRVRFGVDRLDFEGTWRGVPVHAQLELGDDGVGPLVDLRAPTGAELAPGHDVTLPVTLDVGSWFAGDLLDQATQVSGAIQIDEANNVAVGQALVTRALSSFTLNDAPVQ